MITFREYLKQVSQKDEKQEITESVMNEEVQASLQSIVDALIDAGSVAQTAHWNLRSSAFVAIHPWFGETYDALFSMADAVAEQIKISNIDNFVNVNRGTTVAASDEQELFSRVKSSLEGVKYTLEGAMSDATLTRTLQSLLDGWMADIEKMIWFIEASTK